MVRRLLVAPIMTSFRRWGSVRRTCRVAFCRCYSFKTPSGPRYVGLEEHLSTSVRHLAEDVQCPGQLRIELTWCDLRAVRPGPDEAIDVLL